MAGEVSLTKAAGRRVVRLGLIAAALLVGALFVVQGIVASGSPDPVAPGTSSGVAVLDIGVLVFREGLECILVLSAITASMMGKNQSYQRPIAAGAGVGFLATLTTWFIAVGIINDLTQSLPALDVQAGTGLLAIIVLLVVMNWFFHKVYWTGWISLQNRKKRSLLQRADNADESLRTVLLGMGLLGFASFYREGFEVVLFLQSYRLKLGGLPVLEGVLLGLVFAALVAVLTFFGHRHLPYKRMLVITGVLLGGVLLIMVGEQAFEMQQAGWLPITTIAALHGMPAWLGVWLSVFPTVETLAAQGGAAALVIGSYAFARYRTVTAPRRRGEAPAQRPEAPPTVAASAIKA
ncbi:MAG: FTR1 family protein [Ktedonobacterales bacterium]|nr:FTR1 family protein [Ktedonobacterales bacterium]